MSEQCTLVKGAVTVTLPAPITSRVRNLRRFQAQGRTENNTPFVYGSAVITRETELRFESLTDAEKTALLSFFTDTVAVTETFTYTAPDSTAYTARFLEPALRFEKVSAGVWDVEFLLELSAMEV